MKTKFTLESFMDSFTEYIDVMYGCEEEDDISEIEENTMMEQYYLKHYKKNGWKLDIYEKTLYMIFDEPLFFNVHDEVDLGEEGYRTITNKTIILTDQYIEYVLV
jgi:hypothetical protein